MNKKVKYLLISLLIIILLLIAIFSIVKTKKDKEDKIDNTKTEEKIVKEETEEKTDIEVPQEEEPKEIEEPVEEPPKEEPKKEEKPSTKPKENKPKEEQKPSTPTEPPVTYTCPDGYTLNDTKCTITIDATLKCPEGTLEGGEPSGCFKFSEGVEVEGETCPSGQVGLLVISLGGPDKYNCYPSYKKVYTCEEGYTLNNNKCTKTIDATKK